MVALLTPYVGGAFYERVVRGATSALAARNARCLVVQAFERQRITPSTQVGGWPGTISLGESRFTGALARDLVDAYVITHDAATPAVASALAATGKPVVLLSHTIEGLDLPLVVPDNVAGVRESVQHLVDVHGHRRISFVGPLTYHDLRERHSAYRNALGEHGIAVEDAWLLETNSPRPEDGVQAARRLVAAGMPTTATIVSTDLQALTFLDTLRAAGVRVPQEHAVIGFDDTAPSLLTRPGLTTVRHSFEETGASAARLAHDALSGRDIAGVHVVESALVVRESCGCPPRQRPRDPAVRPRPATGVPLRSTAGAGEVPAGAADPAAPATQALVELFVSVASEGTVIGVESPALATAARAVLGVAGTPAADDAGPAGATDPDRLEQVVDLLEAAITRPEQLIPVLRAVRALLHARSDRADDEGTDDAATTDLCEALVRRRLLHQQRRLTSLERFLLSFDDLSRSLVGNDSPRSGSGVVGCFGVETSEGSGVLRISGTFGPVGAALGGLLVPTGSFPPPAFSPWPGATTLVVPVETGARAAFLALAGDIMPSDDARINEWSVLLTAGVEQEFALGDLAARARQQEAVASLGQLALGGRSVDQLLRDAVDTVALTLSASRVAIVEDVDGSPTVRCRGGSPTAAARPEPSARPWDCAGAGAGDSTTVTIGPGSSPWGSLTVSGTRPAGTGPREHLFLQQVATVIATAVQRSRVEESVRHQARHDSLTGLANRVVLRESVDEHLRRASPRPLALLLLDLDGFKDVNDALGHAIGDEILQQVAARLLAVVDAEGGLLARLGGDEFAVLLPHGADQSVAARLAERVLTVFTAPFGEGQLDIPLTVSIGVAVSPDHGSDASTLLRHADVAMYRAKASRSGWAAYVGALDSAQLQRLSSVGDLRNAIRAGQLRVHYQPLIDLGTGRPRSVEALVRWCGPSGRLIAPDRFIPLAEQSHLIGALTLDVLERALHASATWRAAGLDPPRVAVNLSPRCFEDRRNASAIRRLLIDSRDVVTVEITETALADADARNAVQDLAHHGVFCAVDDFGTGYASLDYLRSLPVHQLKIDRTFVTHLVDDPRDRAIVTAVNDLATALDLSVVAEGVETADVAGQLLHAGVRLAQGYLWSHPLPADELARWWAAATTPPPGSRSGGTG